MKMINYKAAGVDRDAQALRLAAMRDSIEATYNPAVLSPFGAFAGLYDLRALFETYSNPVLVQSMDGLGTKTMLARSPLDYRGLGADLVSAVGNDILVSGAKPLTFLDYIASNSLASEPVLEIVKGITEACQEHEIVLLAGETAEMPLMYADSHYDLVGTMTGVVERDAIISGEHIRAGDLVLAFPSSGLHSNGYSLARKLFFEKGGYSLDSCLPDFGRSLAEVLLAPHLNYCKPVQKLLRAGIPIKGMVHITGGGLLENIIRILPADTAVELNLASWDIPVLFRMLADLGSLDKQEMFRCFNMGLGYLLILEESVLELCRTLLADYSLLPVGQVISGPGQVLLCA